jgi:hypothetical protein
MKHIIGKSLLILLLISLNLKADVIHEKIINELSLRTEVGQNKLMMELVSYGLAHSSTKFVEYNPDLSVFTITPSLSDSILATYNTEKLLKKMLAGSGFVCDAPLMKALRENGITYQLQLQVAPSNDSFTTNGIVFLPHSKELVKKQDLNYLVYGNLDEKFWCTRGMSIDNSTKKSQIDGVRVFAFKESYFYEREWLDDDCISKIGYDIYHEKGIFGDMRKTQFVKDEIALGTDSIYGECKKNVVKYLFDKFFYN